MLHETSSAGLSVNAGLWGSAREKTTCAAPLPHSHLYHRRGRGVELDMML